MAPKFGTILKSKDNLCLRVKDFIQCLNMGSMAMSITNQDRKMVLNYLEEAVQIKKIILTMRSVVPGIPGEKALLAVNLLIIFSILNLVFPKEEENEKI